MEFGEIVQRFNYLAFQNNHSISTLPQLRKKLQNKSRIRGDIIFGFSPKRGDYTFHIGGNTEFQFNFGNDPYLGEVGINVFRYGIAFSIERNEHFFNPEEIFRSKVQRFNEFLQNHKGFFGSYIMYINKNGMIRKFNSVRSIHDSDIISNTFIFIGRYLNKASNEITDTDIELMLKTMDYFLECYKYVESNYIETRIARMCWNTNNWIKPSGKNGKSKSKSHEKYFGFGHEEWNFNTEKIIGKYKYGFLEAVQRNRDKYIGNKYDIMLYTVDGETGFKYWVGKLTNVTVIDKDESLEVYKTYKAKGWLNEMKSELKEANASTDIINEFITEDEIFNIKYDVDNIYNNISEKPMLADQKDERLKASWYVLYHLKNENAEIDINNLRGFRFEGDDNNDSAEENKIITKSFETKSIEYPDKHGKIQKSFLKYLQSQYGKENVNKENPAFGAHRIDIVRKTAEGNFIFYEVKTYDHLITSLRVALGQLFEYSFYPDVRNSSNLVLVSDLPPDGNFEKYIKNLNKICTVQLSYIQFDADKKEIVKCI